jgi:hypothetical protein
MSFETGMESHVQNHDRDSQALGDVLDADSHDEQDDDREPPRILNAALSRASTTRVGLRVADYRAGTPLLL